MTTDETPDELLLRIIRETNDEEGAPLTADLAEADQVRAFVVELAGRFEVDLNDVATMRAVTFGVLAPGLYVTANGGARDAIVDGDEVEVVDALAIVGFVIMALYEEAGRGG